MSADGLPGALWEGISIKPFESGTVPNVKFPHTSTDTNTCSKSHALTGGNDRMRTQKREENEQNDFENGDEKQSNENVFLNKEDEVATSDLLNQAKDCCNLSIPTDTQHVSFSSNDREVCKTGIDELLELFPFICGICDEKYNKISRYLEHVASHVECKEDFFHICLEKERTEGKVLAKNHQLEVFLCGLCNTVFETVCHLHVHLIQTEEIKKYIYDESTHTAYKYNTATTGDKASYSEIHSLKDAENKKTSRESKSCRTKSNTNDDVINKALEDIPVPETNNRYDEEVATTNEADTCSSQTDAGKYKVVKLEVLDDVESNTSVGNNENAMMTKDKCDSKLDTATKNDMLQAFKQTKKKPGTGKRKSESEKRKLGREKMVKTKVKQEENSSSSDSINTELDVAEDAILDNTDEKAPKSKLLVTVKSLKTKKNRESERVLKPCQICGKMYTTNSIKQHEEIHTESRNFECDICHKWFKGRSHLRQHKTNHTDGQSNYTCDVCGKAFKTLAYVNQHRRTHTAEHSFSCPLCPEKFMEKKVLRKHMHVHSDVRPHVCETCGKTFKRIDVLTQHKKSHSEARPFSCKICGKTFKFPGLCKRHEMIHEPPRHFCVVCNKGFRTKSNRKIHMKVHAK